MIWRVFVKHKPGFTDHRGESIKKEWQHAGYKNVTKVLAGQAYEISGGLTELEVRRLADKLLTDPITQQAVLAPEGKVKVPADVRWAEVWPKTGVSDPVAETVRLGARDLNLSMDKVRSGAVYEFYGKPLPKDVKAFCEGHLMNSLVQQVEVL